MRSSRFETDERDNKYMRGNGVKAAELTTELKTENWANIKGQYMFSPIRGGDGRILVQEDPHKDRFECPECQGRGHVGIICKWCKGTKYEKGDENNGYCRDCTVGEHSTGVGRTLGFEACPSCKGMGGTIIVPDETKKNTTTGNILAVSKSGIQEVKVNDKVMFSNYTGNPFQFLGLDFRVMTEKDVLGLVKQLKKSVDSINEGTFADLENTGTAHV